MFLIKLGKGLDGFVCGFHDFEKDRSFDIFICNFSKKTYSNRILDKSSVRITKILLCRIDTTSLAILRYKIREEYILICDIILLLIG